MDQSIQKTFHFILKTEALLTTCIILAVVLFMYPENYLFVTIKKYKNRMKVSKTIVYFMMKTLHCSSRLSTLTWIARTGVTWKVGLLHVGLFDVGPDRQLLNFVNIESPQFEFLSHNWWVTSETKLLEMLGVIYSNSNTLSNFRVEHKYIVYSPIAPVDTRVPAQSDSIITGLTVKGYVLMTGPLLVGIKSISITWIIYNIATCWSPVKSGYL